MPENFTCSCGCGTDWCRREMNITWNKYGTVATITIVGSEGEPTVSFDMSSDVLARHLREAPPAVYCSWGERYIFEEEYPFNKRSGFVLYRRDYDELLDILISGNGGGI